MDQYLKMRIRNHERAVAELRYRDTLRLLGDSVAYAPRPKDVEKQVMLTTHTRPTLVSSAWSIEKNRELCVGGLSGVRLPGALEYALSAPALTVFGRAQFPTLEAQSAILLEKIACGHLFIDGNKRTAYAVMYEYIQRNGFLLSAPPQEAQRFVIALCTHQLSFDEACRWIAAYIQ
jgi:death-on-curing protein